MFVHLIGIINNKRSSFRFQRLALGAFLHLTDGINANKLASQTNVDYEREPEACLHLVDEGTYQAAFFLNPTTAEQVQRIASRGELMPQKSTDFYPKLLTGLVFMQMKIRKG